MTTFFWDVTNVSIIVTQANLLKSCLVKMCSFPFINFSLTSSNINFQVSFPHFLKTMLLLPSFYAGDCFVKDPTKLTNQRMVMVQAKVSDTLFHSVVMVQIQMVRYSQDTIFKFFPPTITATVTENEETTAPITLVNPIGYQIGEQIRFRMLNPLPRFTIGETSGLIEVVSNETFDREVTPFFEIHIEAWKMDDLKMVARAVLNVTVADKNDNAPTFLRKKFYKAIDIDYGVGTDLVSVFALDKDAGMNAKIR